MHLDVQSLRDFYYRSQLGRAAQKGVRDQLVARWGDASGLTVAGYGFAVPLLRPFLPTAQRVIGLMPGPQGAMHWPADGQNHSVLCEETRWPLANESVDRLAFMHGLETSDHPLAVLDEAYRVLAPQGRAFIVVPNRTGLWARNDLTPFGFGRSWSRGQIDALLQEGGFVPTAHAAALFFPASNRRFWLGWARNFESGGRRWVPQALGGVLIVEAMRRESMTRGLPVRERRQIRLLEGVPQAGAQPAWRVAEQPER